MMSLADFDENQTVEPYLTSPRSLEACNLHGIDPGELIRRPQEQFVRDDDEDPLISQLRAEKYEEMRVSLLKRAKKTRNEIIRQEQRKMGSTANGGLGSPIRPGSPDSPGKQSSVGASTQLTTTSSIVEREQMRLHKMQLRQQHELENVVLFELRQAHLEKRNAAKAAELRAKEEGLRREAEIRRRQEVERRKALELQRAEEERAREGERRQEQLQLLDEMLQHKEVKEHERIRARKNAELLEEDRKLRAAHKKAQYDQIRQQMAEEMERRRQELAERDLHRIERVEMTKTARAQELAEKRRKREAHVEQALRKQERHYARKHAELVEKAARHDRFVSRKQILEQKRLERIAEENRRRDEKQKLTALQKTRSMHLKRQATLDQLAHKESRFARQQDVLKERHQRTLATQSLRTEMAARAVERQRRAKEYCDQQERTRVLSADDAHRQEIEERDHLRQQRATQEFALNRFKDEVLEEIARLKHAGKFDADHIQKLVSSINKSGVFAVPLNIPAEAYDGEEVARPSTAPASGGDRGSGRGGEGEPLDHRGLGARPSTADNGSRMSGLDEDTGQPDNSYSNDQTMSNAFLTSSTESPADRYAQQAKKREEEEARARQEAKQRAEDEGDEEKISDAARFALGGNTRPQQQQQKQQRRQEKERQAQHSAGGPETTSPTAAATTSNGNHADMSVPLSMPGDGMSNPADRQAGAGDKSLEFGEPDYRPGTAPTYSSGPMRSVEKGTRHGLESGRQGGGRSPPQHPARMIEYRRQQNGTQRPHTVHGTRRRRGAGRTGTGGRKRPKNGRNRLGPGGSARREATSMLDELRAAQKDELMQLLEEEQLAERKREETQDVALPPEERQRLDRIFTEERKQASQRIMKLTEEHERQIQVSMKQLGLV